MVRKKRAKRTARRSVRRVSRKSPRLAGAKNKIGLVVKNLILFVFLGLVSYALYNFLTNEILINLFFILSIAFGFVSIAFLITLLILLIMKSFRKR